MDKPKKLIEDMMAECGVSYQEVHHGEFNERLKTFFSRLFQSQFLTTMAEIRDGRMTSIKRNMSKIPVKKIDD